MAGYLLFITIAVLTLSSPGPGVLLTINNAINYGIKITIFEIFGLVLGMFILAGLSASGAGILIAQNEIAFSTLKYLGAFYLMYLGYKIFKSKQPKNFLDPSSNDGKTIKKHNFFYQGLFTSLSNPKTIVFFIALFPQFIDIKYAVFPQFIFLTISFCLMAFIVHIIYAKSSFIFRNKFISEKNYTRLNRISGCIFFLLAIILMLSNISH